MKMARFHKQSGRTQSVLEHLTNVSDFCRQNAEKINLSNTAYLIGILHDMGKLSEEFESYMESQMKGEKQSETKVDHGVYGAKYIFCRYENGDYIQKIASQIIAFVICYHHGGLSDCIGKNEIPLIKRMGKLSEENLHAVTKEFEELFSTTDLTNIFSKACEEIQSFIETISKKNIELDSFFFDIHLLIKTLYSILIDSDWLDSYLFEADIPIEEYKSSKPLETTLICTYQIYRIKLTVSNIKNPMAKCRKLCLKKETK
jgi:CRISPR-associated endonuclease/helicase Cas3